MIKIGYNREDILWEKIAFYIEKCKDTWRIGVKKFKNKIIATLLVMALGTNIYATTVSSQSEINQESTIEVENSIPEQEEQEVDTDQVIFDQLTSGAQEFEANGMENIYPGLKRREKKKWLNLINENNYMGEHAGTQYQLTGLYELAENQYFLIGFGGDADEKLTLAEQWSEEKKQSYIPQGIFQLILMQEDENYFVTHAIYPSETLLTSEEVMRYKKVDQEASNVAIEYDKVQKLDELEDYVGYLEEAVGELEQEQLNDHAKSEVTQYVQYAIEELSTESMVTEENTIDLQRDLLNQMKEKLSLAKDEFDQFLNDKSISFNKNLNAVLKVQTEQVNFKEPIYIQLPDSFDELGEVTGLRVLLDDKSYVYIDGKDFEALAGIKIKIERLKDKKTYDITFLNQDDESISQVEQTITFAFPAKDELSTVVAQYGEDEQNWGGQYDTSSKTIAFGTKYSGQYKVVDNAIKIKDIHSLPSSQQSAIKFMVSKGYLSLENERFYPAKTFSRYEFAQALVKMFFALDTSLTTTFKDVDLDSPYYPYVASGETYDIIKGYADHTFRGNVEIPVEQVISLCARTIADKKGYVYPEELADYVTFADSEAIAKWAIKDIALAVQSGLVTGGGNLSPKAEITRAESAEILYKLFMLLHETSPDDIIEVPLEQKTYSIIGVMLLALLAIWMIKRFIKKNKIILTMIACTIAVIITLIIGFKGGF